MDRRLVIAISFLILALAALTIAGLLSAAGAPASDQAARVPTRRPAPCPHRQPRRPLVDGAAVTVRHLAPAGMSGEFAKRLLACRDASLAPAIHVRPTPGAQRAAGSAPATRLPAMAARRRRGSPDRPVRPS